MRKLLGLVLAFALLASPLAIAQKAPLIRDGGWWKEKSTSFREGFVNGYRAALVHSATPKQLADLEGFQSSQAVEGLNAFYGDFRNKLILIDDAIAYVIDQVKGMPDDQLAAELQKMRKAAASRGEQ